MQAYYSPNQQNRGSPNQAHRGSPNRSKQNAQAQLIGQQISRVTAATNARSPNKARNLAPLSNTQTTGERPFMSMRTSPRRDSPSRQVNQSLDSPGGKNDEVILIEDFDEAADSDFLNNIVTPYFSTIFQDVAMRRHSPKKTDDELEFVDKVAFFEYTLLPGIINDRFFSLFQKTAEDHIYESSFVSGMIKVYLSTFEEKMRLTFRMYDFDNDGVIKREDVRILLSYVPFKYEEDFSPSRSFMSQQSSPVPPKEGMYDNTKQSFFSRKNDQDEIVRFTDHIFGQKQQLTYDDFSQINQKQTSEMFTSIMRVLHEMLPCSRNFFSMKRKYRQRVSAMEESDRRISIREIASPRMVRGLSLGKSPMRKSSSRGVSVGSSSFADGQSRFSSMQQQQSQMNDVRVKLQKGREHVRNSSRQNKASMSSATGNFLPELNDVSSREDNGIGPVSPKKLHIQNKIRNKNTPQVINFAVDNRNSTSLSEAVSEQGSPMTPSKAFGMRNYKRPTIDNPRKSNYTTQDSVNMNNSQNGQFAATMSPGASLGRFKINLQKPVDEIDDRQMRINNSTLGSKTAGKLLPMVKQGSPNQKRGAAYQTSGGRANMQSYDKSLLCHSPDPIGRGGRNIMAMEQASASGTSAISRSRTPNNQIVLEGFGGFEDVNSDEDIVEHSGNCYLKTKTESYKKHFLVISGNELRFYRKQGDTDHKVMHCLAGTYLKDVTMDEISEKSKSSASRKQSSSAKHRSKADGNDEETKRREKEKQRSQNFHPIKLVIPPNKSRLIFFSKQEDQQQWISWLQDAMGYSNVFNFYTLDKTLGKGQFGLVKLAIHNQTNKKVAIKQVKKKNMTHIEVFQQRREIEVLKMCQHPNIINLVDLFENSEYYYIVLDYMAGSDLFDYLQIRDFALGEDRVRELTYQLALGIKYLHNYGIVHRDLKLENIMMTDTTDVSVPKLVDFGLAKMIGPNEKASEPFGTLGYVAPEILEKKPYTFSCDLWSLGCIVYALLCSSLPFDHDSQKETIRMTCEDRVVFDSPQWASYSQECQDLIFRLLIKKPEERITLDQALAHPWFRRIRPRFEKQESTGSPPVGTQMRAGGGSFTNYSPGRQNVNTADSPTQKNAARSQTYRDQ